MQFNPESERLLREHGFIRPDGTVARKVAAQHVGEFLSRQPDGASVDVIASAVFGTLDPGVKQVVQQLTTLDGPVQKWIDGRGGVLLIKPGKEILKDQHGHEVERRVRKRYIVEDPDVIWKDLMVPLADKRVMAVERSVRIIRDFVLTRRPELKARLDEFTGRLSSGITKELAALSSGETAAE